MSTKRKVIAALAGVVTASGVALGILVPSAHSAGPPPKTVTTASEPSPDAPDGPGDAPDGPGDAKDGPGDAKDGPGDAKDGPGDSK